MATIHSLKPSITELSFEDALSLIINIRTSRRAVKETAKSTPAKVQRGREAKSNPKQQDIFQLANNLSDAKKKSLLERLKNLPKT